jgi:hypothetical protein
MRIRLLLFSAAVLLLGCAADDGFRARLAQGCRSEMECSQLVILAEARAGSCRGTDDPGVVVRLRVDIRASSPPCDEVEADRRVAHGYLDPFTRERERQAARSAQEQAVRREQESAREAEEQGRRRAAEEAELRLREERAGLEIQGKDAQVQAERAAWERANQEAASKPQPTPIVPETPTPRETGGHVCCCDGTLSPTCTTVHRGCCSHHGGVCACD